MSPSSRRIVGVLLVLLLLAALPAALFVTRQQQDIRPRALAGKANLILSSSSLSSSVGAVTDVVVSTQITDANIKLSGADVIVLYDKAKLGVTSIIPAVAGTDPNGVFTDSPFITSGGTFDSTYNYLRFVVVARKSTASLPSGTVQLGKITFVSLAQGAATIKFPDDNSVLQIVGTTAQ